MTELGPATFGPGTYPRRRRGTGTIEQMPDGSFRPRMPGGARDRLRACPNWQAASDLLDAALLEQSEQALIAPGGFTLATWGETFLDAREKTHANASDDRSGWNRHVLAAHFARWPLKAITPVDVRDWRDKLLRTKAARGFKHKKAPGRPLSRTRVQNLLNLLRVALGAAVERGHLPTNPAEGVRLPRGLGQTHDPWTYLLPEEQTKLLICKEIPEASRLLYQFAIGTGLRESELWNLHLVDAQGDALVVRFGSRGGATKGKRIRRVPLFGLAAQALERWRPLLAKLPNPHKLVWPSPRGEHREDGKAPRFWRKHLKLAGLEGKDRHDGRAPRFHDLRHTCGSSLCAGWWGRRWTLQEVQQLLGHRSITTTERYAHLAETVLKAAARAADALAVAPVDLSSICPAPPTPSARKCLAPPAGIGPATFGLGTPSEAEELREDRPSSGRIVDLSARALAALEALADGRPEAWRLAGVVLRDLVALGQASAPATSTAAG